MARKHDDPLPEHTLVEQKLPPRPAPQGDDTERVAAYSDVPASDEAEATLVGQPLVGRPDATGQNDEIVTAASDVAIVANMPTAVSQDRGAVVALRSEFDAELDSLSAPTLVNKGRGPVPSVDVDDVFTSGGDRTVTSPIPVSPGHLDFGPTERHRSSDIQISPRIADIAEPVDLQLGGYRVHHFLGTGGMATVYLARAPDDSRDVIIKRIRPERLRDERNVGRFMQEARIALTLQHPHIVRALDYAEEGPEHFLVMEYLDGYDLRDLAKRLWAAGRTLPLEPILQVLAQAARGLDYAHRRGQAASGTGVIHRDVSPENIFLTADGSTKVLDFGLALGFDSQRFSATGEVMGKLPYLSPEAVRQEELDGRADVFSLCVTAWWLLTCRRPFGRKSPVATLQAILEEDPPPLREGNPSVPPALTAILRKGLEKDRRWRYHRAADVADALEEAAGDARLPPDAMAQLVRAADACPPPPEHISAPFPPTVPWREWRH